VEERLRDLEALVLRQAERIDDLETQLALMARSAVRHAIRTIGTKREAA